MKQAKRVIVGAMVAVLSMLSTLGQPQNPPSGFIPREGRLELPLVEFMKQNPDANRISVVVVLTNQVTEQQKRNLLHTVGGTNPVLIMEQQRRLMVRELYRVATNSQAAMLQHLRGLETDAIVFKVRPLWLPNAIGMQAPPSVIRSLATSNIVDYIHLDLPRKIFQQAGSSRPKNIKAIHADNLDPIPNSRPAVVAVLDSGVKYTHPNLASHLWINEPEDTNHDRAFTAADLNQIDEDHNGFTNDVVGWNFAADSPDPIDQDGHGTAVAGIIAGDGTRGMITGVAPRSQIMILRDSEILGGTTEQQCWDAIQYAITNKASILNFSSGFGAHDTPPPDYSMWRKNVTDAMDSGVLFVTSAGDFGNVGSLAQPLNIAIPGNVSTALSVGYTESDGSVSEKSSKGPVTWTNTPPYFDYPFDPPNAPGLIKPDLVAPGDAIKTLGITGNSTNLGGSSASAPHVSGVAALVLEKHPDLNPYEIRFILEETATATSNLSRPNTNEGWGLVDAKAALEFNLKSTPVYDLSVAQPVAKPNFAQNKLVYFSAGVTNLGGQVVGNAEMRFYFADAANRQPSDLNLTQNGEPDPSKFKYIGSYFVPIVGPKGSKHEKFDGMVGFEVPSLAHKLWIGVVVKAGAKNKAESNLNNNRALSSFP